MIRSLIGDCRNLLPTLADRSAHCCVTSPPYFGLRDYGACDCGSGRFDLGQGDGTGGNMNYRKEQGFQIDSEAHFATFPPVLIEPCILAGCPKNGTVLDPFGGAGTTGMVADRLCRNAVLIELNPQYANLATDRIKDDAGMFADIQ